MGPIFNRHICPNPGMANREKPRDAYSPASFPLPSCPGDLSLDLKKGSKNSKKVWSQLFWIFLFDPSFVAFMSFGALWQEAYRLGWRQKGKHWNGWKGPALTLLVHVHIYPPVNLSPTKSAWGPVIEDCHGSHHASSKADTMNDFSWDTAPLQGFHLHPLHTPLLSHRKGTGLSAGEYFPQHGHSKG